MKKKLSLLLALLMLTSIAALAACSKVEPITVKVVINVAEELSLIHISEPTRH